MRLRLGALVALALVLGLGEAARAQDYESARKHFEAATEMYGKGQYVRAADEFDAAYAITKDPTLLYNIGDAYEKAGNGRGAVRYYRRYLAEATSAEDRPAVKKKIAELEKKYDVPSESAPEKPGKATATTPGPDRAARTPSSARPSTATTPAKPSASAPGGAAASSPAVATRPSTPPAATTAAKSPTEAPAPTPGRDADEAPSSARAASPAPAATASTPAPSAAESAPSGTEPALGATTAAGSGHDAPRGLFDDEKPSRTRLLAWVGVAGAVALVTAGAIFGLAAQSRADDISSQQTRVGTDGQPAAYTQMKAQQINDLRSEGETFNGVAIGMFAAAGAVAVTSGVLFFLDHRAKPAEKHVRIVPAIAPSHVGVAAGWEF